jgi:hypothetical protein
MYSHISFRASLVLMNQYTLKPEQRRRLMHDAVSKALQTGEPPGQGDRAVHFKKFIESNVVVRDLFLEALRNDKDYQLG